MRLNDYIPSKYHIKPSDCEEFLETKLFNTLSKYISKGYTSFNGFIIIDDCLGSINWNLPIWTKIFSTIRHYKLSIFVLTQYLHKVSPIVRTQAASYIFLKMLNWNELKAAYDCAFNYMTFDAFKDFVKFNTNNYNCIFVNNHSTSNDNIYKIIKAPEFIYPFTLSY